ncbi:MAG TPA: hypothetical protein VLG27_04260 [Candidatus Saccharimonadia bacterium]|nr:hypothetical protein [Candidatus Saccharimonadia bacterium]
MGSNKTQGLNRLIELRTEMLLNDSRTFLAAKTMSPKLVKLANSGDIGGGNLLVALGMMSLLEFHARIYWMLQMKSEDLDSFSKKQDLTIIPAPQAVSKLLLAVEESDFDLGLPRDAAVIEEIWKLYRNELSHYLWIHNGAAVSHPVEYLPSKSISEIENEWSKRTVFKKPFEKVLQPDQKYSYFLSAEIMRLEMPALTKWLKKRIDASTQDQCNSILRALELGYK